jgi:hypothetical protein
MILSIRAVTSLPPLSTIRTLSGIVVIGTSMTATVVDGGPVLIWGMIRIIAPVVESTTGLRICTMVSIRVVVVCVRLCVGAAVAHKAGIRVSVIAIILILAGLPSSGPPATARHHWPE